MGRAFFQRIALVAILALAGCGTGLESVSIAEREALAAAATAPQRLQAGERIKVDVFGEAQLSGDYRIDPSGYVSLPLAGTIRAVGLTPAELERDLAKKFRGEYLRNPKVTVTILSFRPFYIVGEVTKPGEYEYKSGLNVLTAIAIAGGTTYRANRSTVGIQHAGERDMKEYPQSASIPILPGDLIKIPERYF